MAAIDKAIKKEFIKYTKEHFPEEADKIIKRADAIYPVLYAKAPDIGGKENLMSYNLDMFILALSFYEASDHRIDGPAITEMGNDIFEKYRFLRKIINVNHKWQMNLFRKAMYKRYIPYAKLVDEKLSKGEWATPGD